MRLADLPWRSVRRRVVVVETDPRLFTGTLRDELDPSGDHDDARSSRPSRSRAATTCSRRCPAGLDNEVEERGRAFSGGQRQRLALTRALLTDAETLVLVEPTSAVDAHTEARIAGRLTAARAGRTTVVMSASPLLLDQADHVVFLRDGRVAATRHPPASSWPTSRDYRRTVVRGEED